MELLNAGWTAQRQGAISEAQFLAIGELAPTLFSELVPSAALLARAEQRSAVLLTQDHRLLRKVREVPQAAGLAMAIEDSRWRSWRTHGGRAPAG